MTVEDGALLLGAALTLLGYGLVVAAGFRRELLWGLINLVPGVSLAFVLLYWRRARVGFILSLMGLVVVAAALYGGADRTVRETLARHDIEVDMEMPVTRPWDEELPNQALVRQIEEETGEPLEIIEFDPYAPTTAQPLPPAESFRLAPDRQAASWAYRQAIPAEWGALEGERVRLTLADGDVREGNLIAATARSLFVQQIVQGGHVAFEYRRDDVRRMEVWDAPGASPRVRPDAESVEALPAPAVIFEAPQSTED
ncbi:hypothetical protein [Ectothiorhodospira marina]|uniref:Uncharacterized protein n=1 Tax=Ectothiorhodospira marina TaxID=1396821 RepID=A0A1H7K4B3_9GAMM|nr:hypothetical protein [Ectothiorhodospira marina]SEK81290.1 hypothetical protein SAMN05444515_105120 [Ectothiorhodospira marina]